MKCPVCKIEITETARALLPKGMPEMQMGVCPKCGCQEYEMTPEAGAEG